jgi:hypothetical protein
MLLANGVRESTSTPSRSNSTASQRSTPPIIGGRPAGVLTPAPNSAQDHLVARRRGASVALLSALIGLAAAAPASAQTVTSVLVRGTVFWGAASTNAATRFTDMAVFGVVPGSRVAVSCRPGGGRRSCAVKPAERNTPASGLLSIRTMVRGSLRPADELDVAITDPAGRRKVITFTITRRAVPRRETHCFSPDGSEVACVVGCVLGAQVPPGDPCEGAGEVVRIPRSLYKWYARWTDGTTRFTRLRIKGLPAGVQVVLICAPGSAGTCPFGLKIVPVRRGFADIAKAMGKAHFLPGSSLLVLFVRTTTTTEILEFRFRHNRKPREARLCRAPADPAPRRC